MKSKSLEQIQHEIREEFENSYKERLRTMQSMFQLRYQSLYDAIGTVYERLRKDELLGTMVHDRITSVHIDDRIKQIFGEVVAEERQLIFKKMGTQIASLKFQNEELARQIKRMKQSTESMERDFYTERESIKQVKNSTSEELRKLQQQNYTLQAQRKVREKETDNMRGKLSDLEQENQQMRQLLMSMKDAKEGVSIRDQQINNYKNRMSQMQEALEELKSSLQQNQQKFDRKYSNKKKEFKQKIQEYKTVITQLRNDKTKTENNAKKIQEETLNTNAEKKMTALIKDHERKISEVAFAKEKQRNELERKHQYKIKEMQDYFQKLLEHKIAQIQENANTCYEKLKEEGTRMEKYIQQYEEHYMPVTDFEEEVSKRDQLILIMKRKLGEFEGTHDQLGRNQEQLLLKLRETESIASDYKQKLIQADQTTQQIVAKIKVYEQANNIFKINEKKSKDQFEEYQRLVKKHREDYDDSKRTCIRLQQEKSQMQNIIREKQRKIKSFTDEMERMQTKLKRMNDQSESIERQRQTLATSFNDSKKEITNLQFKLKDQELSNSLQLNSWQNKLNNAQMELKQKISLLSDLQAKYQEISNLYQEEKKKNYEIENQLKKQNIENNYFKESDQLKRNQQKFAVEQLRKIVNDKNKKIETLQAENETQRKKRKTIESENSVMMEKLVQENKSLKGKIIRLDKIACNKLENLRKEGRLIKDYLQGRHMVFKNDEDIFKSTFVKELIHLQIGSCHQREAVAKRVKEELTQQNSNSIKMLKNQLDEERDRLTEKSDAQKRSLIKEIKQKQSEIDNLNRSIKKITFDLKKQKQKMQELQKQKQFERLKLGRQKQTFEIKLQEVVKEMKDQKDSIIKEYSEKKNQMEQEIQNLVLTLKKVKNEVENIQMRHQEEKSTIHSQLRTVKEQEEIVQKVVSQKDKEIQKYLSDIQHTTEAKRTLEGQLRGCIDTINKKIQLIHELELKENQLSGDYNLIKSRSDRITEQNSQLKRKLSQREQELEDSLKTKVRLENQLKDIKGALNRSSKNQQLRSLNELSMETLQLSQKVSEMRKVSAYLDSKTPLRS